MERLLPETTADSTRGEAVGFAPNPTPRDP